ncbi:MAG: hypothetical protein SCARUB_01739 [Candidatus Scalindua rubra]|uniref:DUF1844 domain-containing protein n=1 Tax=Candidatus Scalindua rubra TaxID=1872076 RepID=A0A1E3XBV8_9BACT|nr:MAG: hypothetical protein SCARUB_01739 [Candidatus Scalindua rubra]
MSEDEKEKKSGPKKIVDEDWKTRVEEEKELEGKKECVQETKPKIPEASFSLFVSSLATQILISLGELESPFSKKTEQNLDQAKFTIDTLQIIKDKTKGNLTDDETKLLDTALYDLRMRYVAKSK